jgi:predicted metal-binding protein
MSLLHGYEICQHATSNLHRVGEREGASLLQVLQQVQAHFGSAVFGILRVQPLSLVETQCPVKGGLE